MAERQSSWGKWITGVIIAAVVIAAGIWHFAKNREDDPQYNTVGVDRGDLTQTVTATGTLNPVTNVLVGCQVSGRISKVY
ncbi:MAG TPA: hypothetical protein VNV43_00505, partial [Candidatus Acidoferrales bacterium]|nr:hypothetical protein [Candidatus Acidoferrales bacterium]